ncbi:hypothetical protein QBC41DRAFT_338096 [Cercophora samala]|uniref:Uncharacterized protein n=1 Tax=Cercophora samala TaxID=330535 RepID=A0AA39ZBB5_9PEZI|nr:hypothetical protein QBC41DRAFT_338096 [Cercophora samala]
MLNGPGPLVVIDDDGDLILRVGAAEDSVKNFKVDSTTLRRASKVLKAMLFGPWAESRKPVSVVGTGAIAESWTVELPDDDPLNFGILMSIAHARFDLVPEWWTWSRWKRPRCVGEAVALADKYDMLHLLGPFAFSLVSTLGAGSKRSIDEESFVILETSWELGSKEAFARELKSIVLFASLSEDDPKRLVYQRPSPLVADINLADFVAPDILEKIAKERLYVLGKLVDFIKEEYRRVRKRGWWAGDCLMPESSDIGWADRILCAKDLEDGLETNLSPVLGRLSFHNIKVEEITQSAQVFYRASMRGLRRINTRAGHHKTCSLDKRFEALWKEIKSDERWEPENLLSREQRVWMEERRKHIGY